MRTDRVRPRTAWLVLLAASLAACGTGTSPPQGDVGEMGADASVGSVLLRAVHLRPPPGDRRPPDANAIVAVTLFDEGDAPDTSVSVSAPAAERVELRWDRVCDGTAEIVRRLPLRPLGGLPEPAAGAGAAPFDPYDLRLVGLREMVFAGAATPLVFTFQAAGRVEIDAPVLPADAALPEPSRGCTPSPSRLRQPEERNRP
jgi:copper(I)-binding protein